MAILPVMRLYRHYADLPRSARGAVLAIGNFDGLHRGHQTVIRAAREAAAAQGCPHGVLTFEPHPRLVFRPDQPPFRLTPFRSKARLLEEMGIDLLYVLRFAPPLYRLPAEDFVRRVLVEGLGVRHVVVGDNFHFGAKRGGTPESLRRMGGAQGFGVTVIERLGDGSAAVSSTEIRQLLVAGDMRSAARLLGRPWEIDGRVLHGAKRGRELNMPTANIDLGGMLRPAYGVFAVEAAIDAGPAPAWRPGVANLGISPMFSYAKPLLEVHLLDFSGDLYGRQLRVRLIERLRPEMTFDGLPALMAQMQEDARRARSVLGVPPLVAGAEGD